MSFQEEINILEDFTSVNNYIFKEGTIPILFTSVHNMTQFKDDGTVKVKEGYTKALALYLNKYYNVNCFIKVNDTGLDSNRDNHDEFKEQLLKIVKNKSIKLVIDLHGAKEAREFDVEFGTLNNLTADFSTIKELEEAFTENNISNITHNTLFKGGAITKYLFNLKGVDAIQLEINHKYRDNKNIEKLEQLSISLGNFIKQYNETINREEDNT